MSSQHKFPFLSGVKKIKAEGIAWFFYALLVFLFSLYTHKKAEAAGVEHDETLSGRLSLVNKSGESIEALHLSTHVDMEIHGLIAKVTVFQSFTNNANDWREGVYVFPLSDQAAVTGMEMVIGDRRIKGEIKEKEVAKHIYQQAKAAGKKASLVSQQRPNLFTQKVANIPPGETISVSLTYTQQVAFADGEFSIRFPLTLTPRYIPSGPLVYAGDDTPVRVDPVIAGVNNGIHDGPGSNVNSANTNGGSVDMSERDWSKVTIPPSRISQVADAHLITPPMKLASYSTQDNRATINIALDAGFTVANIQSLYHDIDINRPPNQAYEVTLLDGDTVMDRDFVLEWRATPSTTPHAAVFKENIDGEDYMLLMLMPPQVEEVGRATLSRDIIFVVDTSGSMQGTSMAQAKRSLQFALNGLKPSDRFNIIEFDSGFSRFKSRLIEASEHNVEAAMQWVQRLRADNGTEMYSALEEAFDQLSNSDQATVSADQLQQIVFITDGAVGNEEALFSLIHRRLAKARLFTVGIGSAPNSHFMKKAAQFGRGTHVFVGDTTDVTKKMNSLLSKLENTVASDIQVQWPQQAEAYPQRIPDLYAGEPLLIAAKTSGAMGEIHIHGQTAHAPWQSSVTINPNLHHSGVSQVWAKSKVDALEDSKTEGADPALVRQQVIDVALTHTLITPYTSFVAVEQALSRPEEEPLQTEEVRNHTPQGQTVKYPQTATSGTFTLVLGILFLLLAFALQLRGLLRSIFASVAPTQISGVHVE